MDRNGVFLLLLSVLLLSHASLFANARVLVDEEAPKDNSTSIQKSPLPSPSSDAKSLSNPTPISDEKSNVKPRESQPPSSNSSTSDSNESDRPVSTSPPPQMQPGNDTKLFNITEPTSSPHAKQADSQDSEKKSDKKTEPLSPPPSAPPLPKSMESGKKGDESGSGNPPPEKVPHETNSDKGGSQATSAETCRGISNLCRDDKSLVACTLSIETDSKKWLILVQNEGEESLRAKIVRPGSVKNPITELTIQKHQSQRVNISISGDRNKIILEAGHGECVLHMDSLVQSEQSNFIHLPSYEKLVTPINGAYLLIFSVIVFGGTWACCLFRKNRRAGSGVPYQELEMGGGSAIGARSAARDVETADWDESWDDDWDEVNAVKSPGGAKNVSSISANGLTARGSSRDGWENDWDD